MDEESEIVLPPSKGVFRDSQIAKPPAPGRQGIRWADRTLTQCPWPEWGAGKPATTVCGAAVAVGSKTPWCPHHHRMVYVKPVWKV